MAAGQLLLGLEHARKNWGWYLVLGIVMAALGTFAIIHACTATFAALVVFGWLLMFGGGFQIALAFQVRSWSGFFLHLLAGVLELVVGFMVLGNPEAGAVALTLVISAYLLVGGMFRMVSAIMLRFPGAFPVGLGGFISFLLGIMVWSGWPYTGLWFIGMCIGIDLLLDGGGMIGLAFALRRLKPATA